jgi:hypothetical protein
MTSATPPTPPMPPTPPCTGTSFWKWAVILMVIACLVMANTETFQDLIVFSMLCFKYGASVLLFLQWIVCGCVQFVAYIVNISSWKLTLFLAVSVGVLCYMVYMFCCQCISIVQQTVRMLFAMFVRSIYTTMYAIVGLCLVAICFYSFSTAFTKYSPHAEQILS